MFSARRVGNYKSTICIIVTTLKRVPSVVDVFFFPPGWRLSGRDYVSLPLPADNYSDGALCLARAHTPTNYARSEI